MAAWFFHRQALTILGRFTVESADAARLKLTLVYLLGFALDLINMFIVSVAYPDIGHDLGASLTQLAWVGNAYMLGLTLVIPLSVWLAGAYGERRVLLGSLALFLAGAALAGTAPSIETLIVWRALQAWAAAC